MFLEVTPFNPLTEGEGGGEGPLENIQIINVMYWAQLGGIFISFSCKCCGE
jgi:hypothetical protein